MVLPDPRRLSHAYLLSGPDEDALLAAASDIARGAVCSAPGRRPCGSCRDCRKAAEGIHPDIQTLDREPDKRSITVGQARQLRADAQVLPNEAERKVYILIHADTMNDQAQNPLLKTLEEPPSFAVFLLLAANEHLLLETVRSRCTQLPVPPPLETAEAEGEASELVRAVLESDRQAILRCALRLERMDRTELGPFLLKVKQTASPALRGAHADRAVSLIETADEAERFLAVNVSGGHVAGLFLTRLL